MTARKLADSIYNSVFTDEDRETFINKIIDLIYDYRNAIWATAKNKYEKPNKRNSN